MAQYVQQYSAVIPAGTPQSSPVNFAIPIDNLQIEKLDLEVPHGPAGTMGFAIFNSGTQWKPDNTGEWIVWDGRNAGWWLNDQPNAGNWSISGYNTGVYDHTVITRWLVNPVPHPQSPPNFSLLEFVSHDVPSGRETVL